VNSNITKTYEQTRTYNNIQHLTDKFPSLGFRKSTLFSSVSGRVLSLLPRDTAQCCEAFTMTKRQAIRNNTGRMPLPY